MKIDQIAAVCHDANRRYCMALGDESQWLWSFAPRWQKDSAIEGVKLHLRNPDTTPEESHEAWLKHKAAEGWVYGPVKDMTVKEHPCMVLFSDLPPEQQAKDRLFKAIVTALAPLVDPEELEPSEERAPE